MSNSSLVNYTLLSPNKSERTSSISKITIHHMAGNLSVEDCGRVFQSPSRQASSNYGIGTDGRVGLYVDEKYRSWATSSRENDNVAVTIEVANSKASDPWPVSDAAYNKLILLCADICKRNGIARLNYTGDKSGNLTMHKWFAATLCPGPYLESKFGSIANEVNKLLSESSVSEDDEMLSYEQFKEYMGRYEDEKAKADPGKWSEDAREWAEDNNIIQGDENGMRYKSNVTREELVTVLKRLSENK